MTAVKAYVFKRSDRPKPWNVVFLDPRKPGEEVAEGREFKRWRRAMEWVDGVMREEGKLCPGGGQSTWMQKVGSFKVHQCRECGVSFPEGRVPTHRSPYLDEDF